MTAKTLTTDVLRRVRLAALRAIRGVPEFEAERFASYDDYRDHLDATRDRDAKRERAELALIPAAGVRHFVVPGCCGVCREWVWFYVNYDNAGVSGAPNWRESLICPRCGLNNRMRACFQLLRGLLPEPAAAVYLTEQVTAFFDRVKSLYPNAVGSEFLEDGTPRGAANAAGVRCEDLTRLSFADDRFDVLVSLEVLEHVPDYHAALRECARVLRRGGTMLLTVPFHSGPTTTTRARVGPGGVEHLLPPEYHGDPLSSAGCLCFYHFGGDLVEAAKAAGFRTVSMVSTYSLPLGNPLRRHPIFTMTK